MIGYRDLAELAVAVEREVGAASPPSPTPKEVAEPVTGLIRSSGPPAKFHAVRDILISIPAQSSYVQSNGYLSGPRAVANWVARGRSGRDCGRPPKRQLLCASPGLQLRNWLRARAAAGHPVLTAHVKWQRWEFTREEADGLMHQFWEERDGLFGRCACRSSDGG